MSAPSGVPPADGRTSSEHSPSSSPQKEATGMTEPLHTVRFPGESEEYRRARDELLQAEVDLRRRTEAVAAKRRALPLGGAVPEDYCFEEVAEGGGEVRFSELFQAGK